MGHITVTTDVRAPIGRCFDLARDVDAHGRTSSFTAERVVPPGRTSGLLELGEEVTFEGRHFGWRWRMTARIVEMDRPLRFVDEIVRGPFRHLRHVHEFTERAAGTEMVDTLDWQSPLGLLGIVADRLILEHHTLGVQPLVWYLA